MNELEARDAIERADHEKPVYGVVKWGEKVNKTLKERIKDGVDTYDWVIETAHELYERAGDAPNVQRKLLDTLAKTISLKVNACIELIRMANDVTKGEATPEEKQKAFAEFMKSPFLRELVERGDKLNAKEKDKDDD